MKNVYIVIVALLCVVLSTRVFAETASEKYIQKEVIQVLIVPGHDEDFPGAVYGSTKEADMTLSLALKIQNELQSNPLFSVTVARTHEGYIPELVQYFKNVDEISAFRETHTQNTRKAVEQGDVSSIDGVVHNNAPSTVVTRLYGINKWATEQGFDIVVHIHFNDVFPRVSDQQGDATGFAVYVPGPSLPNNKESLLLGNAVGERLKKSFLITNHLLEQQFANENGVIEDEKLIALGANGTLAIPSILVEYGYLYEKALEKEFFPLTTDVMSKATVEGLLQYSSGSETLNNNLYYTWNDTLRKNIMYKKNSSVLALQYALHELGLYPSEKGHEASHFDGIFGSVTYNAVKNFQNEYELVSDGIIGPASRKILNSLFSH